MKTTAVSLILAWALATAPTIMSAQEKVVERSSSKKPKWVNALEQDYIIVTGTGNTIELAQSQALMAIKESIVEAIAVNVKTNTNIKTEELSNKNSVLLFLESFSSNTSSQSAKVPFLQGISLSLAEGYYWERVRYRDNSTRYIYHIKYPFPVVDMNRLAFEFKLRDEELTEKLNKLSADNYIPSSVEEIESLIGELRILADYFMDGRKDVANLAIRRYNSMLSSIELVDAGSTLGTVRYTLKLGNSFITTVKKPTLRSECSKITGTDQSQGVWVIKYDYSDCYADIKNNVVVRYRFGSNNVEKIFYFDINQTKVDLFISQSINFTKELVSQDNIERFNVSVAINAKTDAPFTIKKLTLELKGIPHIVIDNINESFSGKGIHNLNLVVETPINTTQSSSLGKPINQMNGTLEYLNNTTGERNSYRIYNQTYNTNW